uniref:Uncharacterized protein n=1 Tax=Alexandrium monilatum TaxID=311494 RepID=A0A7S4VCX5_9DINO
MPEPAAGAQATAQDAAAAAVGWPLGAAAVGPTSVVNPGMEVEADGQAAAVAPAAALETAGDTAEAAASNAAADAAVPPEVSSVPSAGTAAALVEEAPGCSRAPATGPWLGAWGCAASADVPSGAPAADLAAAPAPAHLAEGPDLTEGRPQHTVQEGVALLEALRAALEDGSFRLLLRRAELLYPRRFEPGHPDFLAFSARRRGFLSRVYSTVLPRGPWCLSPGGKENCR